MERDIARWTQQLQSSEVLLAELQAGLAARRRVEQLRHAPALRDQQGKHHTHLSCQQSSYLNTPLPPTQRADGSAATARIVSRIQTLRAATLDSVLATPTVSKAPPTAVTGNTTDVYRVYMLADQDPSQKQADLQGALQRAQKIAMAHEECQRQQLAKSSVVHAAAAAEAQAQRMLLRAQCLSAAGHICSMGNWLPHKRQL
ncbi:hypothetical protein V8C86DRAFT_1112600 [Haematococcus lacustris]